MSILLSLRLHILCSHFPDMHMLLRTSQEAPCFQGAADSLARYVMTIKTLC